MDNGRPRPSEAHAPSPAGLRPPKSLPPEATHTAPRGEPLGWGGNDSGATSGTGPIIPAVPSASSSSIGLQTQHVELWTGPCVRIARFALALRTSRR